MTRGWLGMVLVVGAMAGAGCQRGEKRKLERVVVPLMENQTADGGLAWVGATLPAVMALMAAGKEDMRVVTAGDQDWRSLRPTQVVHGRYEGRGERLRVVGVVRDVESQKIVKEIEAEARVAELGALALSLTRQLTGEAREIAGKQEKAMAAFGRAALSEEAGARRELLETAVKEDGRFTPAVLALAQMRAAQGDRGGAVGLLQQAAGQLGEGHEKATVRLMAASLSNDAGQMLEAVKGAVQYDPANTELAVQLGTQLINRHQYAAGVAALEGVLAKDAGQAEVWNLLAYGQAYAGNSAGALKSVGEYRKTAPQDPNIDDTEGELHWFFGRFGEAEKSFLTAQQKAPQFLGGQEFAKAAMARLMAGDGKGADGLFGRYLETRQALKDPLVEVRQAHWWYVRGEKAKALEAMKKAAGGQGEVAAVAGVWQAMMMVMDKQGPEVLAALQQAAKNTRNPALMSQVGMVAVLNQAAGSAAERTAAVGKALAPQTPEGLKKMVLGYALVHGKHWGEAAKVLGELWKETSPGTEEVRMLYGRALWEAGKKQEAKEMFLRYPLPPAVGEGVFSVLWFPQFLEWRKQAGL